MKGYRGVFKTGGGGDVVIIMHSRMRMTRDLRISTKIGWKRVRFSPASKALLLRSLPGKGVGMRFVYVCVAL